MWVRCFILISRMSEQASPRTLGKFYLIAELGHGGMAEVFLVVARGPAGFSKLQVIKRLRPSLAESPEVVAMFLDEARLAARLNHPNVVQTYEIEQNDAGCFIAMEYLDGQPLDRILRRAKRKVALSLSMHLRILNDALLGLHYAHELCDFNGIPLQVVHRDISPHNIFVTYEGQVKVVDFGIAKAADRSIKTGTGILKGKVAYMSPEQVRGEPLDRRSDIFTVGILLYEALSGNKFWGGLSEAQILHRLTHGILPSLVDLDGPDPLRSICSKAIAWDPAQRFSTAMEFHDAIKAYLQGVVSSEEVNVGGYLAELFQEHRKQVRSVIDAQFRALRAQTPSEVGSNLSRQSPPPSSVLRAHRPAVGVLLVAALLGGGLLFRERAVPPLIPVSPVPSASSVQVASIVLHLHAEPPSTTFFLDEKPLSGNPFVGHLPRDGAVHQLRVEASGYITQKQTFEANTDLLLDLTLIAVSAPSASSVDEVVSSRSGEKGTPWMIDKKGDTSKVRKKTASTLFAPTSEEKGELPLPKEKPLRKIDKENPWNLRGCKFVWTLHLGSR